MTHPGPDFLPYPLPEAPPSWVPQPAVAPTPGPTTGRWSKALDGVPPLGVVSIGSGLGALVLLILVTGVADRPGPGATVTALAAAVSLVTGWVALRKTVARDSRTLVVSAQSVAALSAVLAAMVYASHGSSDQVVQPPNAPLPSSSAAAVPGSPLPTPTQLPAAPIPSAGAVNGFGLPSQPGQPISDDPTALGTLQGHVVDPGGAPIAGATVTITRATAGDISSTPQCPTRVTTLTEANGIYQLQLCQLGNDLGYHVRIQVGKSLVEHDLYVNSGQTTTYDVILPRR